MDSRDYNKAYAEGEKNGRKEVVAFAIYVVGVVICYNLFLRIVLNIEHADTFAEAVTSSLMFVAKLFGLLFAMVIGDRLIKRAFGFDADL